ncbi:cupin domain-containing protein [Arthrobacter sp. H20]|uniref:cupin domain-containing protein n=1 Tax=Arthrobacter sp. H20 TaxID=1267981 RepID=UPI00047A304B|nr:cupin domain-containing protein [Arthrobacter sp. H20]
MADMLRYTIPDIAADHADFRGVIWTGEHSQLVMMTIPPGGEIGTETHKHTDQLLSFVRGTGEGTVGDETHHLDPGDVCAVPAGTMHNFVNTGEEPLALYTIYSPPEHAAGAAYANKEAADAAEASGQDAPPAQ